MTGPTQVSRLRKAAGPAGGLIEKRNDMTAPESRTAEAVEAVEATVVTGPTPAEPPVDPAEALVEEVSIDGMCGVY